MYGIHSLIEYSMANAESMSLQKTDCVIHSKKTIAY